MSVSVAKSDACQTGDQVAGLILAESGKILLWRLIMKYSMVILSFLLNEDGQISLSGKYVHKCWLNV